MNADLTPRCLRSNSTHILKFLGLAKSLHVLCNPSTDYLDELPDSNRHHAHHQEQQDDFIPLHAL